MNPEHISTTTLIDADRHGGHLRLSGSGTGMMTLEPYRFACVMAKQGNRPPSAWKAAAQAGPPVQPCADRQ